LLSFIAGASGPSHTLNGLAPQNACKFWSSRCRGPVSVFGKSSSYSGFDSSDDILIAETVPGVACSEEVLDFADTIAFGTQRELTDAYSAALGAEAGTDLFRLMQDEAAQRLIRRFADNFILLVTVEDAGPTRMIVRYSYDEPLTLTYKSSRYDPAKRELSRVAHTAPLIDRLRASLGHSPLAIRFPVPAAEYALSYHFEIEAPQAR
jgi:hypothetical protein